MDLSVIVPCHNLENYIIPLLNSLNEQELDQYTIELIFVCDSCTDNTRKIIESYPFDNPNIIKISIYEVNFHSCGLTRNVGLENAKGDYIWFIDGDDWLIEDNAIDAILTCIIGTDEPMIRFDYNAPGFHAKGIYMMVWQYVFERKFLEDIRFIDIQPHEDIIFMKEVFKKKGNDKVLYLQIPFYLYNYKRPGSNMTQYLEKSKIDP